jgi:hypothetical protein
VNSIEHRVTGRFAKIGSDIELAILDKLRNHKQLKDYVSTKSNENVVYYRTSGGRYYHVISTHPKGSSKEKPIYIKPVIDSRIIGAILSSNLYFWLSQAYSNNLDLNVSEVLMCPIPEIEEAKKSELISTFDKYLIDLEKNAVIKKANYNNISEFKEYRARLSKIYLDKIDRILQSAYGLTDEQTNYLINFELEFRTDSTEE